MNPEFIDGMSWEMAEVYGAITDQILINLAHYFKYWKPGEPVPKSSFEYQANMLAQMGQVNKDTIRIIRNGLSGADEALKGTLEQAIIDSVRKAQPDLLEAVKKGVLSPTSKPAVSPSQMQAFQLYYQQAADKLNLVNTVMLESTQSAYQQCVSDVVAEIGLADGMNRVQIALDTAAGETVTGVSSWNQALKHATDRMKESGIVGFIDHAGRRWSAEAYAAMDIRTTVANTARAAVWETNQDFGNDLYQVSYHNGARPLCYPWQNKVISSLDAARTVVDLDGNEIEVIAQSATSYGQPAGLFGINCKHYPTPFIPGVSIVREGGQDEEANAKSYAESQQQRGLERKIREEKRDLLMLKAQGAPDELIKAQRAKIRQTDDDIDAFCDATGRARRQNREGVYTKREFPDVNTYDVATFEQQQKEMIEGFYSVGGEQVEFSNTPGMTPNMPLVQTEQAQTQTNEPGGALPDITGNTVGNGNANENSYFRDFGGVDGVTQEQAEVLNARFKELDSIYHAEIRDIKTTLQRAQDEYDIQYKNYVDQLLSENPKMRTKTAEKRAVELLGERPTANKFDIAITGGDFGKVDRILTINPEGIGSGVKSLDDDIIRNLRKIERNEKRLSEGKIVFPRGNVGVSVESSFIHEYGHAIDFTYGISTDSRFIDFYNALSLEERQSVSEYGATNAEEFVAEAFLDSFMGQAQSDISKRFMKIFEVIINGKR